MPSAPLWFTQPGMIHRGVWRGSSHTQPNRPRDRLGRCACGSRRNRCMWKNTRKLGIALRLFGIWSSGDQPYAWYTFSQDPSGRERKRFERVLETHGHRLKKLVIDCPRQSETTRLVHTAGTFFPNVETGQYISSHLGAITARRRTVLFCWKDASSPPKNLSPSPVDADDPAG